MPLDLPVHDTEGPPQYCRDLRTKAIQQSSQHNTAAARVGRGSRPDQVGRMPVRERATARACAQASHNRTAATGATDGFVVGGGGRGEGG